MPPDFHFLRPLWFLMLLPLLWLVWSLARQGGAHSAWRGVVDPHLLPHLLVEEGGRVRRTPLILLALGWIIGVVALAGPVWQRLPEPVFEAEAQRVIALDISRTMNATDVPPSRLARARFEVLDLLKRAAEGQTALLAYGAEPYVVSPLTNDAKTIAVQVPSLKTDILPVEGKRRTDLALEKAAQLLRQAGSRKGQVILVTDGLARPAAADEAARKLVAEGYRVSVLGVGTEKGAPVPMADGGFLKDARGAILIPRLERGALTALAAAGGGRFVMATFDDADVHSLIAEPGVLQGGKVKRRDLEADQWREEGPWLLLALLPLAALAFRRGWLGPFVLVVLLTPPPARAFEWQDLWLRPDEQAARALAAGKPAAAAAQFQRPDWRAAAQYEAGDYGEALKALAGTKGAQADYNRGNSFARLGKLEDAVKAYDQALAADPQNADARFNRDLVQKLLEQRKRQQQQKPGQGRSSPQQGKEGQKGKSSSGQQGQGRKQTGRQGGKQQQADAQQGAHSRREQGSGKGTEPQAAKEPKGGEGRRQPGKTAEGAGTEKQRQNRQPPTGADAGKQKKAQASQAEGERGKAAQTGEDKARQQGEGPEPGRADLLGSEDRGSPPQNPEAPPQDRAKREEAEAMKEMLRRVPDDPGGLLRQRFLLQHLRRIGEMP